MATPVFVPTKASLQTKLRLSGQPTGSDGEAVLDEAILQVRTALFRKLGPNRVATIKTSAYNEDATTDAEVLRLAAAQVEVYGVKARLLRDAPTFFMEGSNASEEAWNDEGILRDANSDELISYYEDLFAQGIEGLLSGDDPPKGISVRTISPSNTAQKVIGQSIASGRGLGGLWPSST